MFDFDPSKKNLNLDIYLVLRHHSKNLYFVFHKSLRHPKPTFSGVSFRQDSKQICLSTLQKLGSKGSSRRDTHLSQSSIHLRVVVRTPTSPTSKHKKRKGRRGERKTFVENLLWNDQIFYVINDNSLYHYIFLLLICGF